MKMNLLNLREGLDMNCFRSINKQMNFCGVVQREHQKAIEELQKNCLDKEKVREILDGYLENVDSTETRDSISVIKGQLGL